MENQEQNEEMEIQHRQYIMEEEINISDLPDAIKKAMRDFNTKLKKYESLKEDDVELFHEIQTDDVAIADDILTWLEDENSESEEEEEYEEEEQEEEEQEQEEQEQEDYYKEKADAEAAIIAEEQKQNAPKEETVEEKIRAILNNNNNRIDKDSLEKILGREADYPEEIVGSIKLRKRILTPFYELK